MTMATTRVKERTPDLLAGVVEPERPPAPKAKPKPAGKAVAKAAPPKPSREVAVHKPQPQKSLLQVCADAARDKNVDVSKMRELLAMAREEEQRQLEAEFNADKIAARAEMPDIVKDRDNPHTRSKYATLEKISGLIDPVARKHGFTHSYGMADSPLDNHYRVICDLAHKNGMSRRFYMDVPPDTAGPKGTGNKTGPQGAASSISIARRVLKTMIWDLAIVGQDNDGAGAKAPDPGLSSDELLALNKMIKDTETDSVQFCEHFGIDRIPDMPKARYAEATRLLDRKAQAAKR